MAPPRRISREHLSPVLQRDGHVVVAEVWRTGRIVDRGFIWNVIGRNTGYAVFRSVDYRGWQVSVEP